MRAYGLFSYSTTGNDQHEVHPDPPAKKAAKPFHVLVRSKDYIPISYLIFARDAKHAWKRVEQALKEVVAKGTYQGGSGGFSLSVQRAQGILADLASGKMKKTVEPYDTDRICCEVNWASNGGL